MKVLFEQIPAKGLSLTVEDDSWFPNDEIRRVGPVTAKINLKKKHHGIAVDGWLKCNISSECDRCLDSYETELNSDFSLTVELLVDDDPVLLKEEHACTESEMDVQYVSEPVLDVFMLFRQQVLLAVPAKAVCRKACKGLCSRCGKNLNQGGCSCSGEDKISPFGILAGLEV